MARFTDLEGKPTKQGILLADDFSVALTNRAGLNVIDRDQIDLLLKQHKIDQSGLVDPATAARFGQISGIQAMALGTVLPHGNTVRLSVKVIDIETAQVLATGKKNLLRTEKLESLEDPSAESPGAEPETTETASKPKTKKSKGGAEPVNLRNFVFDLQTCELSGQSVTCLLFINNLAKDRVLEIHGRNTQLIDDAGNGYGVSFAEIANSGGELGYYGELQRELFYDTPVRASLTFNGISPQATSIRMLRISCRDDEQVYFAPSFSDVAFSTAGVAKIDPNKVLGQEGAESGAEVTAESGAEPVKTKGTLFKSLKGMLKDAAAEVMSGAIQEGKKKVLKKAGVKPEPPAEDEDGN